MVMHSEFIKIRNALLLITAALLYNILNAYIYSVSETLHTLPSSANHCSTLCI